LRRRRTHDRAASRDLPHSAPCSCDARRPWPPAHTHLNHELLVELWTVQRRVSQRVAGITSCSHRQHSAALVRLPRGEVLVVSSRLAPAWRPDVRRREVHGC
jgi:hypothetical protein